MRNGLPSGFQPPRRGPFRLGDARAAQVLEELDVAGRVAADDVGVAVAVPIEADGRGQRAALQRRRPPAGSSAAAGTAACDRRAACRCSRPGRRGRLRRRRSDRGRRRGPSRRRRARSSAGPSPAARRRRRAVAGRRRTAARVRVPTFSK